MRLIFIAGKNVAQNIMSGLCNMNSNFGVLFLFISIDRTHTINTK